MTIPTTTAHNSYTGSGITGPYPVTFRFFEDSDLRVIVANTGGLEVEKTLTADYVVTGAGNQSGGSITFIAAVPTGYTISIEPRAILTQTTDIKNEGGNLREVIEDRFDRLCRDDQVQQNLLDRTVKFQTTDIADVEGTLPPRKPGSLIGWNDNGTGFANRDASLFSSDATITATGSTTARWISDRFADVVNVKDFGAVGDGVTDDTAAIIAAVASVVSRTVSLPGMVNSYTGPALLFPGGNRFLTTGNISLSGVTGVIGESAVITSGAYPYPSTNPLFTGVDRTCNISGLSILGFSDVIGIATGNVDAIKITISNCIVQEWSGIAIIVDSNSASTLLSIKNCTFYARSADAVVLKNRCDVCLFDDCWVEGPCNTFLWNLKGLYVRGLLGVPTASTAGARWVLQQGTALSVSDSRFGGETGARTICDNYTGPGGTNATKLSFVNNEVYTTGFPVVIFNDIPDVFAFERNYGLVGAYPFQFNTVPTNTRNNIGSRNSWSVKDNQQVYIGGLRSSAEDTVAAIKVAATQNVYRFLGTSTVTTSSIVRNILHSEAGYGNTGSIAAGMSTGASTDLFGESTQTVNGVNGDSQFNTNWTTLMTGLPAGEYTLLVNFEIVQGGPVLFLAVAGQNTKTENVGPGRYTISVPFYFDGTNAPNCGYAVKNISAGTVFAHGGLRVISGFAGTYSSWNSVVYGSAAPVSGYWRKGDHAIQLSPSVGQPKGWICTVAGSPGTWVSEGNL